MNKGIEGSYDAKAGHGGHFFDLDKDDKDKEVTLWIPGINRRVPLHFFPISVTP